MQYLKGTHSRWHQLHLAQELLYLKIKNGMKFLGMVTNNLYFKFGDKIGHLEIHYPFLLCQNEKHFVIELSGGI